MDAIPVSENLAKAFAQDSDAERARQQLTVLQSEFPDMTFEVKNVVSHKHSPAVFRGDEYLHPLHLSFESRLSPYIPSHFTWKPRFRVKPFSE